MCYGRANDHPGYHGFVVAGSVEQDGSFYGDHLSVLAHPKHQYQAIVKFKLISEEQGQTINTELNSDTSKPIIIVNKIHKSQDGIDMNKGLLLHDIVFQIGGKMDIVFDVFHGFEKLPFAPFLKDVRIDNDDVLYFKHFEGFSKIHTTTLNLPAEDDALQYLLYGSDTQSFVSKINHGHFPDIHHIQKLKHAKTMPPFSTEDLKFLCLKRPNKASIVSYSR